MSVSLLGRICANMYTDRVLEYINMIQQGAKRSANAASFGRALDLTTLLRALIHVRHVFQAEETGTAAADDPVTENMLRMARMLQDAFVRILGRDLTVVDGNNHCWHTGNSVPLNTGDFRWRRPWEWIERVCQGRSCGKHRTRHETWHAFAARFVHDHFFSF